MKKIFIGSLLGISLLTSFTTEQLADSTVDNFEDGNMNNARNSIWYNYQDSYSSCKLSVVAPGANSSKSCALIQYELKEGEPYPYTGIGSKLNSTGSKVDLSSFTGIRFKAKGKASGWLQIEIEGTSKEFNHYSFPFHLTEEWKTFEVPFTDLKQTWGNPVPWEPSTALSINFSFNNMNVPSGQMYVDDIEFYTSK